MSSWTIAWNVHWFSRGVIGSSRRSKSNKTQVLGVVGARAPERERKKGGDSGCKLFLNMKSGAKRRDCEGVKGSVSAAFKVEVNSKDLLYAQQAATIHTAEGESHTTSCCLLVRRARNADGNGALN